MKSTNSGVSEVITAILLISLVVSGMAIVAVFVSSLPADTKEVPEISLQVCRDGPDHILLYHNGGDTLQSDEFEVHFLDSEKQIIGDPLPGFEWSIGTRVSIPYRTGTEFVQFVSKEGGGNRLFAWSSMRFCTACDVGASPDAIPRSGRSPLSVQFTANLDPSITSFKWDFGDEFGSDEENPSHTYTADGVYTATLWVENYCGDSTYPIRITVGCPEPEARFTASPNPVNVNEIVTFSDTSTNSPTSWEWDFGDGDSSLDQNPTHPYLAIGSYTVTIRVANVCGSDMYLLVVDVVDCPLPEVSFDYNPKPVYINRLVTFTDTSTNDPTSWEWDFGDDIPSTEQNPIHTYATTGLKQVTFKATNKCGSSTIQIDIYVTEDSTCISPRSSFTINPESPVYVGEVITFTDTSSGDYQNVNWNFGDGNTDIGKTVSYPYNTPGTYTVTLTVSGDCGTNTSPPQQITVNPQLHKSNLTFPSGFYYGSSGSYKYKKLIDFGSNYAYWEYTTTYNPTSRKAEYPSYKTDTYEAVNSAYTLYLQPYNQYYRKSASEVYRLNRWVWNGNTYTGDLFPVPDNTFVEGLSMYYDLEDTFELDFAHPLDGEEIPLGLYRVEVHATGPGVTTSNVYLILPDGSSYKMTYNSSGAYYEYYWDTNPNTGQTVTLTAEVRSTTPYPQTTVTVTVACTPPTAVFSANPTTGYAPLAVTFTDASTGTITSWQWDFNGDGTIDSTVQNPPQYTYTTAGTYTASLIVTGPCGTSTITHEIVVSTCTPPTAAFSANPTTGYAPLDVMFTDASTGTITTWQWDFNGDGTIDSTVQNPPQYTYTTAGTFNAQLTVTGPCGTNFVTHQIVVSTCTPPVAVFSATPTSGYAPLAVTFTEASTGTITTWQWDFNGDGTIDSTVQNPPLYTYTNPGTYNAQLTVTGPCGTSTITHPITVQQQCYTLSGTVTVIGGTLNPSNLRIMAIRHNGPTFYAIPQTNGAYIIDVTNPGTYTISIENCPGSSCSGYLVSPLSYERKLTGGDCFATGINFQVSCTPPTASFTVNPETGYAPLTAVFTDTSSGDHSSVAWDFGDGTTGTGSPVTHEYENPDTYTATMTVSGSCGSDIATKTIIAIRYPGFTVESWIRWTSTPNPGSDSTRQWATIVVDGNTDNNRRYHLQHDQTNAHFEFVVATVAGGGSGTWIFSTTSPVINTWYYVTGVYNQVTGIMAIYVNGVQQASRNIGTSGLRVSPGIYQVGGPSGINWGGSSGQRIFDGDTSGLATYEYVLTTAEIQAHYAAGHS